MQKRKTRNSTKTGVTEPLEVQQAEKAGKQPPAKAASACTVPSEDEDHGHARYYAELHAKMSCMSFPHNVRYFLSQVRFKSSFLSGAYIFDWWETAMVYALYLGLFALTTFGVVKQLLASVNIVQELISRPPFQ